LDERTPKNLGERRGKTKYNPDKWHPFFIQSMTCQRLQVLLDYPCAPTTASWIIRMNHDCMHEGRIEEAKADVLAFTVDGGK